MQGLKSPAYFAAVIIVVVTMGTNAHDLFPPEWRTNPLGQEPTTFENWEFNTSDNPAPPEVIANSYGDAVAQINVGFQGVGWFDQLPGLGTQRGVWDLGGDGGKIVIDIDNSPQLTGYKEIWIQVGYFSDITQPPMINVPGAILLEHQNGILVEDTGLNGGWYLDFSKWRIEPNPLHEQIIISSDPLWGSIIDQVVVDTICVPEPATMGLLVFGGLLMIRKKQR